IDFINWKDDKGSGASLKQNSKIVRDELLKECKWTYVDRGELFPFISNTGTMMCRSLERNNCFVNGRLSITVVFLGIKTFIEGAGAKGHSRAFDKVHNEMAQLKETMSQVTGPSHTRENQHPRFRSFTIEGKTMTNHHRVRSFSSKGKSQWQGS
ncbi:hypothetical protein Bca52824_096404, partial [Brassica carinata]